MKSLSKKIVAIALGGFFLMSVGSTVTEASPFPVDNAQRVQFDDRGQRPDDNPPPPPPPPKKEKHRHDRDRHRVIVGGAMIGAAMNNDF
jgi:hypothetical protein